MLRSMVNNCNTMRYPSKSHAKTSMNMSTPVCGNDTNDLSQNYHTKLSYYKIFNYILYVLHTGIQWRQLRTRRNELHWSNVYKWHNRWSKDGSYQKLFEASVIHLKDTEQLDTSIIHGDGTNTVVKKGVPASVTQDTNTRKEAKRSPS